MPTNFNHAEEIKKKNGLVFGSMAGVISWGVTTWAVWEILWRSGMGPWAFTAKGKFDAIHGTVNYFVHFIYPSYGGDLDLTWWAIKQQLVAQKNYDSFMMTVWLPVGIGLFSLLFTWWIFYRLIAGSGRQAGYIRGSRVRSK